ncbi:MAG TPA: hypothetical protein DEG17_01810 [Cyanobacteria bacterium UBA11149]|nr:hypothetical protein [Cyanobacteria bacterium UBA11367]HBE58788.1 hypothetical protein [Cyanobacteria bacterium UBA11366]HBK66318.1 hypothetical protein [Cyanobacteria bacterium UBA11166]HBR77136.1 hypothetical protein [Cyanobacteria bacterium UBA11159]HBS67624.1 hypothetical protein [Cyanobacteria bacterium UBA11153]HBW87646.1 hypothetical protein [Cyanobacteria bacterium UBA11149]HCA96703.1 hypothetical protein [Cyanobacteria bacterium UBA9226]
MNLEHIAQYYISNPDCELSASVVSKFRQFILDLAQVELPEIDFQYVDYVPYLKGDELCFEDIQADFKQGKLKITTQFNNSDLLGPEVNLIFRCIHEIHHLQLNVGFDLEGEFKTAAHLISLTNNILFKQILFSETMGQVAVRVCKGAFPDYQKVVLFPLELIEDLTQTWQPAM